MTARERIGNKRGFSGLYLVDEGKPVLEVRAVPSRLDSGRLGLCIYDRNCTICALLDPGESGRPTLSLCDKNGSIRDRLDREEHGQQGLVLLNRKGKVCWSLGVGDGPAPGIDGAQCEGDLLTI